MGQVQLLGKKLRKRRLEKGMTLRDLADKTGLTFSFISQLERGVANPSFTTLRKLAETLGVLMINLIAEDTSTRRLVHADQRYRFPERFQGCVFEMLTADLTGTYECLHVSLEAGARVVAIKSPLDTEEQIFIIEGQVIFVMDYGEVLLNTGDAFQFNGSQLREVICPPEQPARYIMVMAPPIF